MDETSNGQKAENEQKKIESIEKSILKEENILKKEESKVAGLERDIRGEKIKIWLKNPYNLLFSALIIFTIIIRLYYFSMAANQPTWWDEGDYLGLAKEIALPSAETPEWWVHFVQMRPLLMSLVWAAFIKLNIPEAAMRFLTEIVPSIILVIFSYLLASSLFNKRVGLITGFLTSSYWVIQFYGLRFMTDIPAMMFAVISCYYFWELYEKQGKQKGLYLCIFFGVLGFLTRFPTALVTFSVLLYLFLIKKHRFFAEKTIWIAGAVGILTLLPYLIFNKIFLGDWLPAFSIYSTAGANAIVYFNPAWALFSYVPQYIGWILTALFIFGLASILFAMILSFDIFIKQKDKSSNPYYFIFVWLIVQVVYFVFVIKSGNDRWMLLWMPPIFMLIGIAADKLMNFLDDYSKYIGIILFVAIIIFAGYNNMTHTGQLVKQKLDSYSEVRDTGLWLRYNSPENAKILGASIVQNSYYSQRRTYDFYINNEEQVQLKNQLDVQGRNVDISYDTIRNETELECKFARIKPDYMILHPWEPSFTPQFMYDYPNRHPDMLTAVKTFSRSGQISAAIYKFNSYPVIDESSVNCTKVYARHDNLTDKPLDKYRLAIPS